MRYKDSIIEVILIERERGSTYKEISDKLSIPIYKVKKVVMEHGSRSEFNEKRKDTDGNLDDE